MRKTIPISEVPPPGALNVAIALVSYAFAALCLYQTSRAESFLGALPWVIAFSFIGNTIFSLLHESVHGVFSRSRSINDWFGRISAAFFPTGFTFQRLCHLGHHRRNRTDVEMFDLYYPDHDSLFLKRLQLYFVLTGVYWTNPATGCLLYLLFPGFLKSGFLRRKDSHVVQALSADAMLSSLDRGNPKVIRWEIVFSIAVQLGLFYFLDLTWWGWLACYWAFGVNWGALQYADHAWSKRDIRNGAWNLKVNRVMEYIFLKYHHHLAHHQHPNVPWIYLDRFVNFEEERPSFLSIYWKLWRGPTPTQERPPRAIDPEFESLIYSPLDSKT